MNDWGFWPGLIVGVLAVPTTIGLALYLWALAGSVAEFRRTRQGKGFSHHVMEYTTDYSYYDEAEPSGRPQWYSDSDHVHHWASMTPWWLIKVVEPLRRRRCESLPTRFAAGSVEYGSPAPSDPALPGSVLVQAPPAFDPERFGREFTDLVRAQHGPDMSMTGYDPRTKVATFTPSMPEESK